MGTKCDCKNPDMHVIVQAACPVIVKDERIEVDIAGIRYSSQLVCGTCGLDVVMNIRDCPFLVMRDIVAQVCTSCVKQDGRVRFATQHNFCDRLPITKGPACEEMG